MRVTDRRQGFAAHLRIELLLFHSKSRAEADQRSAQKAADQHGGCDAKQRAANPAPQGETPCCTSG